MSAATVSECVQILTPEWPAPPEVHAAFTLRSGGVSAALEKFGVKDYTRKWSRIGSVLPSSDVARRLQINRQQPVLWVENVDVDEKGVPIKYGITHLAADRVQLMVEHDR